MTGKTHQILGVLAALGIIITAGPDINPATAAVALVGAHFSSLVPDMDQAGSLFWQSMPMGHVAGRVVNPFFEHRNLTHSLLGIALIGWGLSALLTVAPSGWGLNTAVVWQALMAAYVAHVVADSLTEEGIPLFFPYKAMMGIPPYPFQGMRILTGRWFENLVVFPLANLVLIGVVVRYFDTLKKVFGL